MNSFAVCEHFLFFVDHMISVWVCIGASELITFISVLQREQHISLAKVVDKSLTRGLLMIGQALAQTDWQ